MRKLGAWMAVLVLGFVASAAQVGMGWPEGTGLLGLAWSADGSALFVLTARGGVYAVERWELPERALEWRTEGLARPFGNIRSLVLSPDGKRLAAIGRKTIFVLSAAAGEVIEELGLGSGPKRDFLAASLSPDGSVVALVREWAGIPTLLSLYTWGPSGELLGHEELGTGNLDPPKPTAAFSSEGRFLVYTAGTKDEPAAVYWSVRLRDLRTGSERTLDLRALLPELRWEHGRASVSAVALGPDGKEIAVGLALADPDQPLVVRLDVETGEIIERLLLANEGGMAVDYLAYGPGGGRLAVSLSSPSSSRLVVAGLLPSGTVTDTLFHGREPHVSLAFSPDGRTLAGISSRVVRIWDLCPDVLELPAPSWVFSFSSGGAYHPKGYGEWRVRLDAEGRLDIAHRVQDVEKTYGPYRLKLDEVVELWGLIAAADIPHLQSSSRAGVPDEPRYTFSLEGPTCTFRVELWAGEVEEHAPLAALRETLSRVIEEYTGEEVVL